MRIFKIPLTVHPLFWLSAAFIGFMSSGSFAGTLIWMTIIFISILIHELGHAVTAMMFHKDARIALMFFGGATTYETQGLSSIKQLLIIFNGPFFGFLLFLLSSLLLKMPFMQDAPFAIYLYWLRNANLFWTVVNLIPVIPLDGGQMLRIALEGLFGIKGLKASFLFGMVLSFFLSFLFFYIQAYLPGGLFFLFGFQSFQMYRSAKYISPSDRNVDLAKQLEEAEKKLSAGDVLGAKEILVSLREKTKSGVIHHACTQHLAFLEAKEGNADKAYELLASIQEALEGDAVILLHKLAYEKKDYPLVAKLSSEVFQMFPNQQLALMNAFAFAYLRNAKPSGGWLKSASELGNLDLKKILSESPFLELRQDPYFQEFFPSI